MGLDVPTRYFSLRKLEPAIAPELAIPISVNIAPNQTLKAGTVLGQVSASANDVQTLTVTGTPTGGSVTVIGYNPITQGNYSLAIPYNASASAVQALVNAAVGSGNLTVGGGPLPGTPPTFSAVGSFAAQPITVFAVATNALTGGTSPAATVAHTTTGATAGTYTAYASGNSDGSQTAKALLPWDIVTDSAGLITIGSQGGGGEWGETWRTIEVYVGGYFATDFLTGLDSTAVGHLGKLVSGTLAKGLLRVS